MGRFNKNIRYKSENPIYIIANARLPLVRKNWPYMNRKRSLYKLDENVLMFSLDHHCYTEDFFILLWTFVGVFMVAGLRKKWGINSKMH